MANTDWMRDISDTKYLPKLAIPGTHDSGAWEAQKTPMTRAQTLSIAEQLAAGVRALDIRCAATYGSTRWWATYNVFHGPIDQGLSIVNVMATISDFLDHHTGEVVLLMLKQELTTSYDGDISADVNKIVNDGLGAKVYARNPEWRRWPRLGECRGRVVVLSRFTNPHASHFSTVGWPDNCKDEKVNVAGDRDYGVRIQDLYKSPPLEDKKQAVNLHLSRASTARRNDNQKDLYLNFTSLVWKPWEPVWSGETHMTPYLTTLTSGAGVVCVDAVTEALATHIISWNE